MTEYILMVKILGGEWTRRKINGVEYTTNSLADALGQKAALESAIKEVMVIAITPSYNADSSIVTKTYELVAC